MKLNPVALRIVGRELPEGQVMTSDDLTLYLNGEEVHHWKSIELKAAAGEYVTAKIEFALTDLSVEGGQIFAWGNKLTTEA